MQAVLIGQLYSSTLLKQTCHKRVTLSYSHPVKDRLAHSLWYVFMVCRFILARFLVGNANYSFIYM